MRRQVSHFEVPTWDAIALLRSCHSGRLCIIDHGTPIALPVNFRLVGSGADLRVVIRTSPTGLLGRYEGPASFQVDHVDEEQQRAWSVLLRGTLRPVMDGAALPDTEPWVAGERGRWLALTVDALSARRFTGAPSTDGFAVEWTLEPAPAGQDRASVANSE